MRLLLVEDDIAAVTALLPKLQQHGYVIDHAANGVDGEFMAQEIAYDAIILDLGLPQKSGMDVLLQLRGQQITTPILILTARDSWHERVDGLRAGADDYLGKPFHTEELIARLEALCRRASGVVTAAESAGGISLDSERQTVTNSAGEQHSLTSTEFRLLRYMLHNPNKLLSKSRLLEHIYDEESDPDSNVIEVYIKRLRQKLGKESIVTQRGQGYMLRLQP